MGESSVEKIRQRPHLPKGNRRRGSRARVLPKHIHEAVAASGLQTFRLAIYRDIDDMEPPEALGFRFHALAIDAARHLSLGEGTVKSRRIVMKGSSPNPWQWWFYRNLKFDTMAGISGSLIPDHVGYWSRPPLSGSKSAPVQRVRARIIEERSEERASSSI